MRYLRTNTATRVTVGPFFDKTDGVTPETSLTVTSCKLTMTVDDAGVPTLVLDAAATASSGNNDMVHITNDDAGFYDLELAAANVNYLGRAMLAITDAATHCPVFHEFMILPANVYDSMILGSDALQVHANEITAGLLTAAAFAANAINAAKLDPDVTTELQSGLATAAELAKVPKSDGTATWNATALGSIQSEATDALNAYDPPTKAELDSGLDALPTAAEVWAAATRTLTAISDSAGITTLLSRIAGALNISDGIVESNVKEVNDVPLTGDGSGTPWGPA
jgi:hypothetical protein